MKTLLHTMILLFSISLFAQKGDNVKNEGQLLADKGNGFYKNPIFPGNYGDPTLVRVKDDYYVAFSRTNGVVIWHSKDLVNWKPVVRHRLPEGYNTVWAIDLQYFNGKFHIYMPIKDFPNKKEEAFGNFVIIADKPEGPWSDPINLEIEVPKDDYSGIDPGFIQTPEGEKYLYVNHGWAMRLNDEGTKAISKPKRVYDGWDYPKDWVVECKCLESPKLFYKEGYYYMVSAEGGTSGPSTAHMSIVARAKHPLGP
jgi:beta-xylosidase